MKISIITVCYNALDTIEETINSVVNQEYSNIEYIVVDGMSTDGTIDIIKKYGDKIDLQIIENDRGIYDAINKGVDAATGDIVGILHSDDILTSQNTIGEIADEFLQDASLDALFCSVSLFRSTDSKMVTRTVRANFFRPFMLRFGLMPPHPGMYLKNDVYQFVGKYNERWAIAADFDFLVRFFKCGFKYKLYDLNAVLMRVGGISTSGMRSNSIITREMRESLSSHGITTNLGFLLLRFPIKYLSQVIFRRRSVL